ncbi:FKBP-type peptidyl-prolyl cis-trans isomerase [Croceicoccus naphthovorans]|uniref:Peptidyl-prolyl cis-trans isomerase n=1 Tax=Croceicoccus naphthovorans TaxID=1348774 RepID=A0A0G3XHY0_9SPHN|nr:FKBP-type peptidyl-prolyl cis-trans isomerase [Croceicoccus naphthovorans]AKM10807.1 peptidylprolyl isomerase [Croceicoccus naphthovorans]MBB3989015.1 FKBP-type peptidyl-prolyl cis-trans isomerase FkpA [Croceicoccus naphthovorans]
MAEVTRVPLQPIGKGILGKLWLGVVVAILLAAGAAWATGYKGVTVETLSAGTGSSPAMEDVVLVNYEGRLADGTVFDSGERVPFPVNGVVPGFSQALVQMQKGGRYEIFIPSDLGYGSEARGTIPANSDLTFTVELIDFRTQAEIEEMQRQMQQMGMMPGGPGAPGAAPESAPAE